ncbi:hypothetical protein B0H17DRAFT_1143487 [Mycena rosella]|uniref:Uncharacterized protein n=1 Tax=Mycena rosella TaxID=1033263 RepID=A0AAD7CVL0_MYCRO|nr:hypothetical protein B0H17DRAFT_1143487 [Mycena rosella]
MARSDLNSLRLRHSLAYSSILAGGEPDLVFVVQDSCGFLVDFVGAAIVHRYCDAYPAGSAAHRHAFKFRIVGIPTSIATSAASASDSLDIISSVLPGLHIFDSTTLCDIRPPTDSNRHFVWGIDRRHPRRSRCHYQFTYKFAGGLRVLFGVSHSIATTFASEHTSEFIFDTDHANQYLSFGQFGQHEYALDWRLCNGHRDTVLHSPNPLSSSTKTTSAKIVTQSTSRLRQLW